MIVLVRLGTTIACGYREPLSLEYVAAYLERHGEKVAIVDGALCNEIKAIERLNPDIVGISAMTPDIPKARETASWCRKNGIKVVLGGIHPSIDPEGVSEWADAVVVGDGEDAMLDIVRNGRTGIVVGKTMDISILPMPARHLVDYEHYVTRYIVGERTAAIITSRGCPFSCIYCWNSKRKSKLRYNSVKNVIAEARSVVSKYDIKRIYFQDDDFFHPKSRFKEIMLGLPKVKVEALTRATSVTEDIVKFGVEHGLDMIDIGFESASQRVLDRLNKQIKVESYQKALDVCNRYGVKVNCTFMVGNPGETMDDIELTRQFIARNKFYQVGINYIIPYPGTRLWDESEVKDFDWGKYQPNANSVPVNVSGSMTDDEVVRAYNILYNAVPNVRIKLGWLLRTVVSNPVLAWKQLMLDWKRIGRFVKRLRL